VVITLLGLFVVLVGVALACRSLYGWTPQTLSGVLVGGGTSIATVLLVFLAIQPWKSRPAADWLLFWLGSATVRLLFTPLALFSVYSATLLPGPAVLLGGAAAFFAALVLETVVIARAVLQDASRFKTDG
jgi:hypothetical protein